MFACACLQVVLASRLVYKDLNKNSLERRQRNGPKGDTKYDL